MSNKKLLFISFVLACVIIGYSVSILRNTTAKDTATTEKSVEATSITNIEVEIDGINPVIRK